MRAALFTSLAALSLEGCVSAPNSLRVGDPLDGRWIASVSSESCGIAERFSVTLTGRVFGARIPGTEIVLTGIGRGVAQNSSTPRQRTYATKGEPSLNTVRVDLDFETSTLARGNWRSTRCGGTLILTRRSAG